MHLPSHVQLQQVHLLLDLLLQQRENDAFQAIVQSSMPMLIQEKKNVHAILLRLLVVCIQKSSNYT